jgi:hypothetical protein
VRNRALQKHILSTYNSLRFGMFVAAAATPVVIVLWGYIFEINWQNSISAYYFAPLANKWEYVPVGLRQVHQMFWDLPSP